MSDKETPKRNIRELLAGRPFGLDTRPDAQAALSELRKVTPINDVVVTTGFRTPAENLAIQRMGQLRKTAEAHDLADSELIAKGLFPDMNARIERQFPTNTKKWNTGHFPNGTVVVAGINDKSLALYTVAYLMRTGPKSYVIHTTQPHPEIADTTMSVNIDHVREIVKRGEGRTDIRAPLWDQIGHSKATYALNPRTIIMQEAAMALVRRVGKHSWMGYHGNTLLPDSIPSISMDQLKVMLNRDLRKGRGEYITGSPQALIETLLEKKFVDGQVDSDKMTTLLNARGVFQKKTVAGFEYYAANKKKLNRAIGQLFNQCKVRLKAAEKRLAVIDESLQLNNPFVEFEKPIRSEFDPKADTKLSHYDDHDDRVVERRTRHEWDRLLKDL
jgi:hypothetical protein